MLIPRVEKHKGGAKCIKGFGLKPCEELGELVRVRGGVSCMAGLRPHTLC